MIGAYALRNLFIDVWVMFLAGIVGYLLRRSGYSAAGVVLGLILGKLGESAFSKSMQLMDYNFFGFFERPISALLITLGIAAIVVSIINEIRGADVQKALMD